MKFFFGDTEITEKEFFSKIATLNLLYGSVSYMQDEQGLHILDPGEQR